MQNSIYIFSMIVLVSGLFIMITSDNLVKKIIGLSVFQNSVIIFYIALGKSANGIAPIYGRNLLKQELEYIYTSPLPQVLMLTAIVVGFATMSVGFALIYQIHKKYGTILESKINNIVKKNI